MSTESASDPGLARVRRECFFSGTSSHPVYVDCFRGPDSGSRRTPILMLHGGFHTGAAYLATPDRREGWAPYFARMDHDVYVVDWPGHGRSPVRGEFIQLSTWDIASALGVVLSEIGPAIIVAHSAGGSLAWRLADKCSEKVAAVVGISPAPPANLLPVLPADPVAVRALSSDPVAQLPMYSDLSAPVQADPDFIRTYWTNSARFPAQALDAYERSIVAESPRVLNERFNIGGSGLTVDDPACVARRPILVVTGDSDPRHPREVDESLAGFFGADTLWLPDTGVTGNGHMLMIEDNNHEIAGLISNWIRAKNL